MRNHWRFVLAAVAAVSFLGIGTAWAATLDVTGTTTLGGANPMTYNYDSVTVEPGATLDLIGDVTLNVTGNILINGNIDGDVLGSAAADGTDGEDGTTPSGGGISGREGEAGNSGNPNTARGIDLTINAGGSVAINGGISLAASGYDGGKGGKGGDGSDGNDGVSGEQLQLVSGSGGNAGFGGNGNFGGAGGNAGSPGSLIINAASQITLANSASLDVSNDSKGGKAGDGGDGGGGGNGGAAEYPSSGNGGFGGGGGAAGMGGNGGTGGNAGSVYLFAPAINLQGNLTLTGGEGGDGGDAGQPGDGGDGGAFGGNAPGVGGPAGGGGPGGRGGSGGVGGAGGSLFAIAATLSDSATANFSGGNGGAPGAGSSGGQGGQGGTGGGADGPGGGGGNDGAAGLNGNTGSNVFSLFNSSSYTFTNGNFTSGTFGWRQSGTGSANVVTVNTDGFGSALQINASSTGPFSVAQPINTNINGSLGIGFYYLWTTTNGTLVVSLGGQTIGTLSAPASLSSNFTYEYIFLQYDLSSALNQGLADLSLQLLDPPDPAQIDVTDFQLDAAPVPEPASMALASLALARCFHAAYARFRAKPTDSHK